MKILERYLILGTGGQSRVVSSILYAGSKEVIGLVSNEPMNVKKIKDLELINESQLEQFVGCAVLALGMGANPVRKKLFENYSKSFKFPNIIHPTACVENNVRLGYGCVIAMGAILCTCVILGNGVIINSGATVDHDCSVGHFVHISPGVNIAGNVKVGDMTHIGIGATIIENITIGKNVVIGAGTVVLNNVPDNVTIVGVPGKIIKYHGS